LLSSKLLNIASKYGLAAIKTFECPITISSSSALNLLKTPFLKTKMCY